MSLFNIGLYYFIKTLFCDISLIEQNKARLDAVRIDQHFNWRVVIGLREVSQRTNPEAQKERCGICTPWKWTPGEQIGINIDENAVIIHKHLGLMTGPEWKVFLSQYNACLYERKLLWNSVDHNLKNKCTIYDSRN